MKLDHRYVFRKKQSMSGPVLSVASGIHGGSWNRSSAGERVLLSSPQETGNTVFSDTLHISSDSVLKALQAVTRETVN